MLAGFSQVFTVMMSKRKDTTIWKSYKLAIKWECEGLAVEELDYSMKKACAFQRAVGKMPEGLSGIE